MTWMSRVILALMVGWCYAVYTGKDLGLAQGIDKIALVAYTTVQAALIAYTVKEVVKKTK